MSEEVYTHKATDILNRLRSAIKVDSDAELCRLMNIPTNTFSNWKARDQLNEKPIIAFCVSRKLDLNWVLTGIRISPEPAASSTMSHTTNNPNNDLLVQTLLKNIQLLEDRLAKSEDTIKRAAAAEQRAAAAEQRLHDAQAELVKAQAEIIEYQKKLKSALDVISSMKKKKAA